MLATANVPERFQSATVDRIKEDDAREIIGEMLDDVAWRVKGDGLVINGPFNTGKSSAAAVLAMDSIRRCERVLWVPARDVPSVMFRDSPRDRELYTMLRSTDLLVVDDLGAEGFGADKAGGAALENMARILYERQRPMIVTSNLSWGQLQEKYRSSFVSVLMRMLAELRMTDEWDI